MKDYVWVLKSAYNDYDQHGEYFIAVFRNLPTLEQLAKETETSLETIHGLEAMERLQRGGGRENYEYQWYILEKEELE